MADESLRLLKGTLDVLILKTLSWGPAHGYAISRWIRDCSAEDLRIEEGALYPALRRLEERGWVESTWRATEPSRTTLAPARRQVSRAASEAGRKVEADKTAEGEFAGGANAEAC